MLVLRRFIGESIVISDDIIIKVIDIDDNDAVSIGIEAPKEIPVNRMEIYERLKEQGISHIREGEKNGNQ